MKKLNWDKLLSRGANLANIGLVILAFITYFYTILPVYENQLLSEDISKKELELREIGKKLIVERKTLAIYKDSIIIIKDQNDSLKINFLNQSRESNSMINSLSLVISDKEMEVVNAKKHYFIYT
jgi:hypothetical protein